VGDDPVGHEVVMGPFDFQVVGHLPHAPKLLTPNRRLRSAHATPGASSIRSGAAAR
jgi:hypothetical protein